MEDPGHRELKQKLKEEEQVYADLLSKIDALSENPSPYERAPELEELLGQLNEACSYPIEAAEPSPSGLIGQLRRFARRLIDPEMAPLRKALARQQSFNSSLVQFLNQYMEVTHQRATRLSELTSTLVQFAQRIDRLADAKDRLYASLGNTRTDLLLEAMDKRLETIALGLRRAQDRVEGMISSVDLARAELDSLRHKAQADTREAPPALAPTPLPPTSTPLEATEYVAFENRFRGSSEEIRDRLAAYVPYFEGLSPVVELGCGRGEFLGLLQEATIEARGIDDNSEMLGVCRERGLDVIEADIRSYLGQVGPGSVGGIFAAQVIEHLPPNELRDTLSACHRALRKGGRLVVETVNPRSVVALLESFHRDLTHQKPLHPDTLDFLLRACGFREVSIHYSSPVEGRAKLLSVSPENDASQVLNENFRKLNAILFGDQDYAAIATK